MVVDNEGTIGAAGDLVGRMRRAHQEAAQAEEVTEGGAAVGGRPAAEAAADEPARASPLEQRLVETARQVMENQFDDPRAIRESVVETIVEERYGAAVQGEGGEQIAQTVKQVLSDDIGFRAEVDQMLLYAARRLGRAAEE